ncbi:Uu.00g020670.m01.CDS01 [Anthostomella pinea]|uniref:Uu.00g020670.m01.CDS01 n=1 Tax=Anthostomella pinea TaxID=933095 RepID=A0AAI8W0R3_9PEZI|nr:Uu.00g020670.m01.CDS01 [Anthostomella pinea]
MTKDHQEDISMREQKDIRLSTGPESWFCAWVGDLRRGSWGQFVETMSQPRTRTPTQTPATWIILTPWTREKLLFNTVAVGCRKRAAGLYWLAQQKTWDASQLIQAFLNNSTFCVGGPYQLLNVATKSGATSALGGLILPMEVPTEGPSRETHDPLQRLPTELRQTILASIPDPRSMRCATLSCHAYYVAFKQNEVSLVREVLINYVGYDTLLEATIAYRCEPPYLSTRVEDPMVPNDGEQDQLYNFISGFLRDYRRREAVSTKWTSLDALALNDFHRHVVSRLLDRFLRACSQTSEFPLQQSFESSPATPREKDRIARGLYRFETFRELFGCLSYQGQMLTDYAAIFLSRYPPWEIAQIGCMNDFLAREVIPGHHPVQ